MRRSAQVLAPLLATTALTLLTACRRAEEQRCVDEQNRVVDPTFCKNLPAGQTAVGTPANNGGHYGGGGIFYPHIYRNYYGGSGFLGGFVSGGSYAPTPGHSYSVGGTTRGGFGSLFSGEGHGFGGGHGGGE